MTPQAFKQIISEAISEARSVKSINKEIYSDHKVSGSNNFLFFIKPELTIDQESIQLHDILEMIHEHINYFKLSIKNIKVINATYLDENKIISQHYGVINKLSTDISNAISPDAKQTFEELFGLPFDEANVLGSIEMLEKYPFITPTALSFIWQNSPVEKLAGGTYVQPLNFDGNQVYLVNGFHPRQLEHFIIKKRCIITMTLYGETDWHSARNHFIGATNPTDAEPGSIRNELLIHRNEYGLQEISSSWNGVHLSAGPIEGLIELMRYNSDFDKGLLSQPEDYAFGKALIKELGKSKTGKVLENPVVKHKGQEITIFDLTEELNAKECLVLLKELKM